MKKRFEARLRGSQGGAEFDDAKAMTEGELRELASTLKKSNDQDTFIQVGNLCLHWWRGKWYVVGEHVPMGWAVYRGFRRNQAVEALVSK